MITTTDLFNSGVYFGYPTSNWNPKTADFVLDKENGIYIIDLFKTVDALNNAYKVVKNIVASGGKILFVGTKKQASNIIEKYATECNMPYVSITWSGGTLTNFKTISKRVKRMIELENMDLDVANNTNKNTDENIEENTDEVGFAYTSKQNLTKKEKLLLKRELDKLRKTMNGIRDMSKLPNALFIVDTIKENIALSEAKKLDIPIIATIDTNADPEIVDTPIPGNDNARTSIALLTSVISTAVKDGQVELKNRKETSEKKSENVKKVDDIKTVAESKEKIEESGIKKVINATKKSLTDEAKKSGVNKKDVKKVEKEPVKKDVKKGEKELVKPVKKDVKKVEKEPVKPVKKGEKEPVKKDTKADVKPESKTKVKPKQIKK